MRTTDKVEERLKREKKTSEEIAQWHEDVCTVMNSPGGRRFVWHLMHRAGMNATSNTNGQTNTIFFNEGGRNQGLMLKNDLKAHAPGSYQTMLQENDHG